MRLVTNNLFDDTPISEYRQWAQRHKGIIETADQKPDADSRDDPVKDQLVRPAEPLQGRRRQQKAADVAGKDIDETVDIPGLKPGDPASCVLSVHLEPPQLKTVCLPHCPRAEAAITLLILP